MHVGRQGAAARREHAAWWLLLSVLCWLALAWAPASRAQDEFLDPDEAFAMSAALAADGHLDVHFRIAPRYYMYRDRFQITLEGQEAAPVQGPPAFPPALVKFDPTFGENMAVYYREVTLRLPLAPSPGGGQPWSVLIESQGCADAGLCYPPAQHTLTLAPAEGGYTLSGQGVVGGVPPPLQAVVDPDGKEAGASAAGAAGLASMDDMGVAAYLAQASLPRVVLASLLFGLLLSFTPCVLPMAPILLAILAGNRDAAGGAAQPPVRRRGGLALAALFVLGTSIIYTALGLAAALIGASLAGWLQNPWVLGFFALLLFAMALAMFDVWTMQLPGAWQTRLQQRLSRLPGGRPGAALLMGMLSALIVGPCVAAPLAGVLLFIAQTGDWRIGALALFALAWGQGLLLLVLGASSGALLPRAGAWMEGVKRAFGLLLLATAWWMLRPVLDDGVSLLGWAVLAAWAAVLLGLFSGGPAPGVGTALRRALGLLLAAWSILMLVGLAAGGSDPLRPLARLQASSAPAGAAAVAAPAFQPVGSLDELQAMLAGAQGRPVMLDFYADWCVSCIEMERYTFSDPAVAQRMSRMLLLQADVTANTPAHRELLREFKLFGPPGIVFFDDGGGLIADARVVGFQDAARFGAVLDRVLAAAP